MKIIKNNSSKILIATIAIAVSTILTESVHAKSKKVPEIGWSSRLSSMGLDKTDNLNKKFTFYCQPAEEDLMHAPIWGTGNYTVNSGICSAAIHNDMIEAEDGGEVEIELLEGQTFYTGSQKNEVTSQDHRATNLSFTFIGKTLTEKKEIQEALYKTQPSSIKRVMFNGVQRGVERTIEKKLFDIFK